MFVLIMGGAGINNGTEIIETPVEVEEWMTEPIFNFVEEPLEIEEWMTTPFITDTTKKKNHV